MVPASPRVRNYRAAVHQQGADNVPLKLVLRRFGVFAALSAANVPKRLAGLSVGTLSAGTTSVAGRGGPCLPPRDGPGYPVVVDAGVLVEVPVPEPPLSPSRWAAATTHWLKGVPFMPATCFLLMPLQA